MSNNILYIVLFIRANLLSKYSHRVGKSLNPATIILHLALPIRERR